MDVINSAEVFNIIKDGYPAVASAIVIAIVLSQYIKMALRTKIECLLMGGKAELNKIIGEACIFGLVFVTSDIIFYFSANTLSMKIVMLVFVIFWFLYALWILIYSIIISKLKNKPKHLKFLFDNTTLTIGLVVVTSFAIYFVLLIILTGYTGSNAYIVCLKNMFETKDNALSSLLSNIGVIAVIQSFLCVACINFLPDNEDIVIVKRCDGTERYICSYNNEIYVLGDNKDIKQSQMVERVKRSELKDTEYYYKYKNNPMEESPIVEMNENGITIAEDRLNPGAKIIILGRDGKERNCYTVVNNPLPEAEVVPASSN